MSGVKVRRHFSIEMWCAGRWFFDRINEDRLRKIASACSADNVRRGRGRVQDALRHRRQRFTRPGRVLLHVTVRCRNWREFFRHREPLTVSGYGASASFVAPGAYHTNGVPPITYRANGTRLIFAHTLRTRGRLCQVCPPSPRSRAHQTNLALPSAFYSILHQHRSIMPGIPSHLSKVGSRRLRLPHASSRAKPVARSPKNEASIASTSKPRERPSFPCVEAHAARESRLRSSRQSSNLATSSPSTSCFPLPASEPEPPYERPNPKSYKVYHHTKSLPLMYAPSLPQFDVAYETWGTLSPAKDNVILLHTGLSASSHAASTDLNPSEGWWEKFIGPGRALDTNQFFIICTNVLGGCYGSTGPSSPDPTTGHRYGTRFPILSIFDMVRAQFCLLDHLGIRQLYASVGSSMGAMQSLAAGWLFPERVGKVVSISGTARSSPSAIAMRFAQRSGASTTARMATESYILIFLKS